MGGGAGQRSGRQNFSGRFSPFAEFGGPRMRQMLADFESRRGAAPARQPMMPRTAPTQMTMQPATPMAPGQAMTQDMDIMRRQADMQRTMTGGAGQQMPPQFSGGIGAFAQPMNPMMAVQPPSQQEAEYRQFMLQNDRNMTPMGPMTGQQPGMNPMMNDQARMAAEAAAFQRRQPFSGQPDQMDPAQASSLEAALRAGAQPRMPTLGEIVEFEQFNAPQPGMSPKGPTAGLSPAQVFQPQLSQMRPTR